MCGAMIVYQFISKCNYFSIVYLFNAGLGMFVFFSLVQLYLLLVNEAVFFIVRPPLHQQPYVFFTLLPLQPRED